MADMDELEYAIQNTVKHRRGFSKQVAEHLGMSQQVLLNKINPMITSNHLHVTEAARVIAFTQDFSIIEVMAEMLGCKIVKTNKPKAVPIMSALLTVVKEHGDIGEAITDAIKDDVINEIEERHIIQQIKDERAALDSLQSSIQCHAKQSRGELS